VEELQPQDFAQLSNLHNSEDGSIVSEQELIMLTRKLEGGVFRTNAIQDSTDPILGPINPLAALSLNLKYRLPCYEAEERMEAHRRLVKESGGEMNEEMVSVISPDYENLSWDDIMEIRSHPQWPAFRGIIKGMRSAQELADRMRVASLEIFGDTESSEQPLWLRLLTFSYPLGRFQILSASTTL
jgi:hypothetical protein